MSDVQTPQPPQSVPVKHHEAWGRVWRGAYNEIGNGSEAERIANVTVLNLTDERPLWNATWATAHQLRGNESDAQRIADAVGQGAIKSVSIGSMPALIHKIGGKLHATKANRNSRHRKPGLIEGYLATWGNPRDTDLEREYFTKHTNMCLDWFPIRPILYHHGMDKTLGLKHVGFFKNYEVDELGLWIQAQLDMAKKYGEAVYDLVANGERMPNVKMGWSSGSVEHLVKVADNGEILIWPLIEGSVTPTPAQPSKTTVYTGGVKISAKALETVLPDSFDFLRGRIATGASVKSETYEGDGDMPRRITRGQVRSILKQYGIRASSDELEEVAANAEDDLAMMADDDEFAVMGDDDYDDAVMMDDDLDAMMADDEDDATMGWGYRSDDDLDAVMMDDDLDAVMMDDDLDAMMADDEDDATMGWGYRSDDEDEEAKYWSYRSESMPTGNSVNVPSPHSANMQAEMKYMRPRRRRKSIGGYGDYDARRQLAYLNRRIKALESLPTPGEGGIGRGMKVRNRWDNDGAYTDSFKAYLMRGLGGLYDWQRDSLYGRGADRQFGSADTQYDPATKSLKVLNTASDSSVGFAVPPEWVSELNKNIMSATVMAPECKTRTTNSDRVLIPDLRTDDARRSHAASVSWPGQAPGSGSAHRAEEFQLGQIAIPVHVMLISMTSTLTAMEDVSFDLQGEITEAFSEASSVAYDTLTWGGDGQGKLAGIVNNPDVSGHESLGVQTVGGFIPSGSPTEIVNGDVLIDMVGHLPPAYQRNAKWYMNVSTLLKVRKLKDGEGNYLWDTDEGFRGGMPTSLLGYPVVVNVFADEPTAGNFPIIFGALNQGYTIAQRVQFSVRRFDEVRADLDQVLFIGRARIGGQVTQPAAIKVLKMAEAS